MKKEIVFEILEHLHTFETKNKGNKNYETKDFVEYLKEQIETDDLEMRYVGGEKEPQIRELGKENNSDISSLIIYMSRYAKNYSKKAFQNSKIQTVDEFAFLITLMTHESLTKTELIHTQVVEKTSGIEIIKRLLNQKLIIEFNDVNDKRSKRVAISDMGKKEILGLLPNMSLVSKIVLGNLTKSEINILFSLLKKLDHFHNDIFMNKKTYSLEEILEETSLN